MAWIATIIGGGMGMYAASENRKAAAANNEALMAGFNLYQPYVKNMLTGAEGALNDTLNAGYYSGPTYAGPNDIQTGIANTMGTVGSNMISSGTDMMNANSGFGNNYNNLYGMALNNASNIGNVTGMYNDVYNANMGVGNTMSNLGNRAAGYADQFGDLSGRAAGYSDTFNNLGNTASNYTNQFGDLANRQGGITDRFTGLADQAQNTDFMGKAIDYANANTDALTTAAMRDDRRNLEENVLTGIDKAASGSGNMNSSRAGIAQAVAERGYSDRYADTSAQIRSDLINKSLGQQNAEFGMANTALSNASNSNANTGSMYNSGLNAINTAGNSYANGANSINNAGSMLNSGVNALNSAGGLYGNAGNAYNSAGNAAGGMVNTYNSVGNALNNAGGFNSGIANAYNTGMNTVSNGANMGMNAGNSINAWDNAALNDARANWEGNRDFAMNTYANYNAGILNNAPNSASGMQPNYNSPAAGMIGGAMTGYGMANNLNQTNPNWADRFSINVPIRSGSWFGW